MKSIWWVGGWLEIVILRLISTQIIVDPEVGVELGNNKELVIS